MAAGNDSHGVTWYWEGGEAQRLYKVYPDPNYSNELTRALVGAVWATENLTRTFKEIDGAYKYYAVFWPSLDGANVHVTSYFNDKEEAKSWVAVIARMT